jgi:hypothetical protein
MHSSRSGQSRVKGAKSRSSSRDVRKSRILHSMGKLGNDDDGISIHPGELLGEGYFKSGRMSQLFCAPIPTSKRPTERPEFDLRAQDFRQICGRDPDR